MLEKLIMPRAEAYGSSFVCHYAEGGATEAYCSRAVCLSFCLSVCLLQAFLVAHWKLRAETRNTSRYRYLLGFVFKKFGLKTSFASYGVICLPCLSWRSGLLWGQNCLHMTAWQRIGSICTTDSAAGPEKLRQKAMAKSTAISLDRVLVLQSRPADHCTIWLINICLASVFP